MGRNHQLGIRIEILEAKRVEARAESLGLTVSDYVRALIVRDLKAGGQADHLAPLTTESVLVTALLVGKLTAHTLGHEEAKRFEGWARDQAAALVDEALERAREAP